ncbi:MAG: hypothetical protein ACTHP8_21350 [Bosea sp. (in: a-proteobacteria)]|uniref:hypothetical protein n=1 Tax=Bosea sp. (in: a-proteobacteria) TaxID=1871050 RepID=UPI003F7B7B73
MDFGNVPKVAAATGAPAVARADVTAQPGSVTVDLPPEKTVQSASAGEAVHVDVRAQERDARSRAAGERRSFERDQSGRAADRALDETIERKLVIDPRTRAVVLQKKNRETGETIMQLPDEATLKLRAYSRELTERAREASETPPRVERTA